VTSKGGAKQQVTLYYMSQHFGVCTTVDALRGITVNEKVAWEGRVTSQGSFTIDRTDLFGGPTKQGGVKGTITFLPGAATQVLPDNLAQKLGRANGADCPGYRGLTSVFMTGPSDGQAGFYWTANDPYLPGVWITVERAPVGLSPGYALVPRSGAVATEFPYTLQTAPTTFINAQFSPDHLYLYAISSGFMAWSMQTRTLQTYVPTLAGGIGLAVGAAYAITPSGIVGISDGTHIYGIDFDGTASTLPGSMTGANGVYYAGGMVLLTPGSFAGHFVGQFTGSAVVQYPVNDWPTHIYETVDGDAYRVGHSDSTAHNFTIGPPLEDADVVDTTAYGTSGVCYAFDEGTHHVVVQGAYRFRVTKTRPHAIIDAFGSTAADSHPIATFGAITPGSSSFWVGTTEYLSSDLSAIRTVDLSLWPATGHTDVTGSALYDWYNNSFINSGTILDRISCGRPRPRRRQPGAHHLRVPDEHRLGHGLAVEPDRRHQLRGCGRRAVQRAARPVDDLDAPGHHPGLRSGGARPHSGDAVRRSAKRAADAQADPRRLRRRHAADDQIRRPPTCRTSGASCGATSSTRSTSPGPIPTTSRTRRSPPTTSPASRRRAASSATAAITTASAIPTSPCASRRATCARPALRWRPAMSRSIAPIGRCGRPPCSASTGRNTGLDGVVMRVTSIDYGKPGDPTIKLSLIEDVFGLDVADYVAPPSTLWRTRRPIRRR
jgi:hypothetical protein